MSFVKTYDEIVKNRNETTDFYDAEMITAVWETTPAAIEKLLPPPLQPAAKPIVLAFVGNYPSTNFSLPYKESALFVKVSFEGQEVFYCLSMPVTDDMAMAAGREVWGYPKKLANIELQREGDTVQGSTERHNIQFMNVKANLTGKINDNSAMDELLGLGINPKGEYTISAFNFKHPPSPVAAETFDHLPRLIKGETVFRPKTFIFAEVEVELTPSEIDPWYELPVERMLGGFYTVGDNSMLRNGKLLAEVDSIEFAPYAFLKWEWVKSA
jgi:acetoacetate decarboxylase